MSRVLVDGDIIAYRSAYSTEGMEPEDCEHKVDELIDEIVEEVAFGYYNHVKVYLTGPNNFRFKIATIAPYKGNRANSTKPEHLEHARNYMIAAYEAQVSDGEEADDLIAIAATKCGGKAIIASVDKDFLQVPCTFYNFGRKTYTEVDEWSGLKFFYTQLLEGDRADNIKGVQGVGPKKAEKILADATTEQELFEACLKTYKGDLAALTENGQLLWLRREEDQLWQPPTED